MEGEMDLVCTDGPACDGASAFVVDYKTGGSDDESPAALHDKHLLQAQCYAYALLAHGCAEVELCFVRVEHEDETGALQTVRYRFAAPERDELAAYILEARFPYRS